jgi:hypothetical protein
LSNHRFDIAKFANKNNNRNGSKQAKQETEPEKISLSFAQMEGMCYCCSKPGHRSPQCHFKDRPKAEWAMNMSQQSHAQTEKTETKVSESTKQNKLQPISNKNEGWSGVHHQLYQHQDRMNEWILLDNKSTVTIFCNPNMV